jgi:subtilisin family serine protease
MGLAPGAKILPIGVDPDNAAAGDHIADAIHYAVDHGARIINMSVGSLAPQNAQDDAAIAYAESHNVILVAGAGNDGASSIDYPAATAGVVAVAAVDKTGHVWSQSNYGKGVVLAAPGVDIVRAAEGGSAQYRLANGTSDATAYVSAIAALVVAKYPNLTAGQVINRLVKTALIDSSAASGQVPDPHYGYGIARPYRALTENIPAGPAAGPLAQATASSNPSGAAGATGSGGSSSTASSPSSSSSSTGLIIGAVAIVAVLALILLIVLLVRRGKKNNGGGGGGFGPGGSGGGGQQYPPSYPQYGQPQQQPYPPQAPAPGGYRPPTGNGEQSVYQQNQNNPYAGGQQQPPYGGQPR